MIRPGHGAHFFCERFLRPSKSKLDDGAQPCMDWWHLANRPRFAWLVCHWRGYNAVAWVFTISAFCLGLFVDAENTTYGRFQVSFLSGHHHRHFAHQQPVGSGQSSTNGLRAIVVYANASRACYLVPHLGCNLISL